MPHDIFLPDCDIQHFRKAFVSKAEYRKRMGDMTIKESLFDRKTTGPFEENLRNHIISKALVKVGSGSLPVTGYIISDSESSVSVYVSYFGRGINLTSEGRDGDMGYFLLAHPSEGGVRIQIQSRREHYKARTWALNAFLIVLGLLLGIVPGILIAIFVIFLEPTIYRKKIEKFIVPALEMTFGRVQ